MDYSESSKNAVNDMHYTLGEAYIQDSWKIKPRLTLDYGLRFSYFGPWTDNLDLGMAAFNRANYGDGTGSYPGIAWTAIDPNTPLSGVDGSWFYVTPSVRTTSSSRTSRASAAARCRARRTRSSSTTTRCRCPTPGASR